VTNDPNPLITLFRQCAVRIGDDAGRFRGTGFFVAPGRIVTCAHVVHGAAELRVQWQDRQPVRATVAAAQPPLALVSDPATYPFPDLAVLNLGSDTATWDHPCAALTDARPVLDEARAVLYLAGYTVEHGKSPELTGAATEFESEVHDGSGTFYKLKRGQILHGFSGSPLLDLRSGAVAGVVESTRGSKSSLGGFAVPAAAVTAAFTGIAEANRVFHQGDPRWPAAVEAEQTRAAERAGMRSRLGLRPAVVKLEPGEEVSPATLLRPRHAVVGYVGREQLLNDVAAWCESGSPTGTGLWFVTAGGGFGKTRLAIQACLEAEARGWTAGLLPLDASDDKLQALADWPGRLLIVIDYAETRPALIGRLVDEFAAREPRPPVQIMLLVRRRAARDDLLTMFNQQQEEYLAGLLRRAPLSRLDENDSEVDRLELFRRASTGFAARSSVQPGQGRPPLLRAPHFGRPLYVLIAAYLRQSSAGTDVDTLSEPDLLRELLSRHEAAHWDRWAHRHQLTLDPADQRNAVALATLLTASGESEALTVARLIPHHAEEPEPRLIAIARWLSQLYPAAGDNSQLSIAALEPDRLGEVLVADVLRRYPDLMAAALDVASDRQLTQALTVTTRIARDDPAVREQLRPALDQRLPDLFERGLGSGDALLDAVFDAMIISRPARGALDLANRLPPPLPVWLRPIAVAVTTLAVDGLRARDSSDPDAAPELARALGNLAVSLSEMRRWDELLEVADEAVTRFRQLAEASPAVYPAGLAGALSNRARALNGMGRSGEALEAAAEAVTRYRQLAEASPAVHLADLAEELGDLAGVLYQMGRPDEALPVTDEAVTYYRQLAEASPDVYLPRLVGALSNRAIVLSRTGRSGEALEVAGEAVTSYRQLAEASPDVYLPRLAGALNNRANFLSETGQWDEALEAGGEALTYLRELTEASPAAYLPELARALSNRTKFLSETGQWDEALEAEDEALTYLRELAETSPAAHLSSLAAALNNLARALSETGRSDEALEAAGEAVTYLRQLAETSPAAHLSSLAAALNNLARALSETGRSDEALEAAGEAVTYLRQLAETSPAAYLPRLAAALNDRARFLSETGQWEEASEASSEAITRYRELAESSPAVYLAGLASALTDRVMSLSEMARRDEALEVAAEAVTHYRQLAEASPRAHVPGLASALNNLATALSESGRRDEALEVAAEAVAHYRQLAEASPRAYLPGLAWSLDTLGAFLSEAGRADEAEEVFADIFERFADSPLGRGQILLVRGRWRAGRSSASHAVRDLAAALAAAEEADDRDSRGQARQQLRALRERDPSAFDHAWEQTQQPLPVWLRYPAVEDHLTSIVVAWAETPDLPASRAYLDDNAAVLLTDQAEAAVEHLIDANPTAGILEDDLALLREARVHGSGSAYAAMQEQLLAAESTQILQEWAHAAMWEASRAYAAAHADQLLRPLTISTLDDLCADDPGNPGGRLLRGLLRYATDAGFDAAYELLADPARLQAALAVSDPEPPATTRLALARMHSSLSSDDPEAHFQLAATLLGQALAGEVPLENLAEARSALADCADNAAPYEQRDFARRLDDLLAARPDLAPHAAGLQQVLTAQQSSDRGE
jgi:hypothetical protein